MNAESNIAGIADASKPNAGRMYDYFLGGNHNFEVDRKAAEEVIKVAPFLPKLSKLIRWFLGEAIRRLCDQGYTKFLDFASGLPTADHIHQIAPAGTKVIYSDIDPVTVAYANELIADNPDVRYVHCDAGKPEELLHSDVVQELFGDDRKIAIGLNGIAWFLPEPALEHSLKTLYEWAAPGSKLFISDGDNPNTPEEARQLQEFYNRLGQPVHFKPLERFYEISKPWQVEEPGFKVLEEWVDLPPDVSDGLKSFWGGGGAIYGGFLKKE